MEGPISLTTQFIVAKAIGLLIGVLAFVLMPLFMPEVDPLLTWGVLLWYPTLGAVIVCVEALEREGQFAVRLPWWLRAIGVGAWLNLIATLFAHRQMAEFLAAVFGPGSVFGNPFWFVAEGALVGLLIGYMVVRVGTDDRD